MVLTIPDLAGPATIPAANITMGAPVVTAAAGSSMTGVAGHASTGQLASGEKIVTASAGNGDGTYFVASSLLKLTVPAGTYASAGTIAVLSGP